MIIAKAEIPRKADMYSEHLMLVSAIRYFLKKCVKVSLSGGYMLLYIV